jgi:hypothetical protein
LPQSFLILSLALMVLTQRNWFRNKVRFYFLLWTNTFFNFSNWNVKWLHRIFLKIRVNC